MQRRELEEYAWKDADGVECVEDGYEWAALLGELWLLINVYQLNFHLFMVS